MILPRGYRVGFGVNLRVLYGVDCAAIKAKADAMTAAARGRSKNHQREAATVVAGLMRDYNACLASQVVPTPVTPPPVTPTPVTPPPVVPPTVVPPTVTPVYPTIGTQGGGGTTYSTPSSGGGSLPVPGPTPYPVAQAEPGQSLTECSLGGLGMLPLAYSDQYGPMKVLAVYCGAQQAAPASEQVVQQQIQSSDLWS